MPLRLRYTSGMAHVRALLVALALVFALVAPAAASPGDEPYRTQDVFAPNSFWVTPLSADAALVPQSSTWARNLTTQLGLDPDTPQDQTFPNVLQPDTPGRSWFNESQGGAPIYVVPADQPKVKVCQANVLNGTAWSEMVDLHEAFQEGVPIPPGAVVDSSSDSSLVVWQPSTHTYWEMWVASPGQAGQVDPQGRPCDWVAYGGGRMEDSQSSLGTYRDNPPRERWMWGHTATGLPLAGGVITPEEWNAGEIPHTLHMVVGNAQSGTFLSPAHRTDGTIDDPTWIPEGARVRLPADTDCAGMNPDRATSNLQKGAFALCKALRDYGALITDKTGFGVTLRFRGPETYSAWPYDRTSWPHEYLRRLPWHRAQIVDPASFMAAAPSATVSKPKPRKCKSSRAPRCRSVVK